MTQPLSFEKSARLYEEAKEYLPGGVNSPVRAFKGVGGTPVFINRGSGCRIYDEDGNEFIDYVSSWGPLIVGHANPRVVAGMEAVLKRGTSFGAPTTLETDLARRVCSAIPSMDKVRFVNSGTEAVMSALRVARAFTGRDKIVKFIGGYHGHWDGVLVKAGSGLATLGVPDSGGVPTSFAQTTLLAPYNSLAAVEQLFQEHKGEIAAVIVEPVAANMGVVLPRPGFLEGLRNLTQSSGSLLIFDEVITGFRLTYGSAQSVLGVTPDLITLGKIIGGGMPVGAYGGRGDIMELIAPSGPVYQAGTLSGNPLGMAAGIETLRVLEADNTYEGLKAKGERLTTAVRKTAAELGIPLYVSGIGSMFTAFFTDQEVTDYETAATSDTKRYAAYFHNMLRRGIYIAPSQFEAGFVSLAHGDAEMDATIAACREALTEVRES
jgi:glutamate-1-semialdehyde 2,1-aminomutase